MSGLKSIAIALATAGILAGAAHAQDTNPLVRERINVTTSDNRGQQVRVQSSVNMFIPGPSGESDAATQLRDKARRAIYEMAARECGIVEDVLAKTCRLEAINVSINRQPGSGMGEGYMVGGNMTMVITLK